MAAPENIEIFNRICIALFDKLYSSFPVPITIDLKDIAMSAIPQNATYETTWDVLLVGGEVINFLAEEGFLTHKGAMLDGNQFIQVRLTMKLCSSSDAMAVAVAETGPPSTSMRI